MSKGKIKRSRAIEAARVALETENSYTCDHLLNQDQELVGPYNQIFAESEGLCVISRFQMGTMNLWLGRGQLNTELHELRRTMLAMYQACVEDFVNE